MAAVALRLCLILTLVLNGVSAPLAMAQMDHAAPATTTAVDQHAHHAGHTMPAESPDADHGMPDGSCCDSGECQCGCILPPVVPFALRLALRTDIPSAPALPFPTRFAPPHTTPPFRPPAV